MGAYPKLTYATYSRSDASTSAQIKFNALREFEYGVDMESIHYVSLLHKNPAFSKSLNMNKYSYPYVWTTSRCNKLYLVALIPLPLKLCKRNSRNHQ